MEFNVPELNHVWAASEEVQTPRGLIVGTATGPQTPERALATYRRLYPGKLLDVEKAQAVVWATNPWASACETTAYAPGQLSQILAGPHRVARPHPLRRRVRRQPELGPGSGDAIRVPCGGSDRQALTLLRGAFLILRH